MHFPFFNQPQKSKPVRIVLATLLGIFFTLLIFDAGVAIGVRRAHGTAHMHNGMPPPPFTFAGFTIPLPHGFLPGGHGVVGTIISIHLPTTTIATRDGEDEMVLIGPETNIISDTHPVGVGDLVVGQSVAIVGEPVERMEDQIEARFIHILSASTTPTH